jgi:hypothetical protein
MGRAQLGRAFRVEHETPGLAGVTGAGHGDRIVLAQMLGERSRGAGRQGYSLAHAFVLRRDQPQCPGLVTADLMQDADGLTADVLHAHAERFTLAVSAIGGDLGNGAVEVRHGREEALYQVILPEDEVGPSVKHGVPDIHTGVLGQLLLLNGVLERGGHQAVYVDHHLARVELARRLLLSRHVIPEFVQVLGVDISQGCVFAKEWHDVRIQVRATQISRAPRRAPTLCRNPVVDVVLQVTAKGFLTTILVGGLLAFVRLLLQFVKVGLGLRLGIVGPRISVPLSVDVKLGTPPPAQPVFQCRVRELLAPAAVARLDAFLDRLGHVDVVPQIAHSHEFSRLVDLVSGRDDLCNLAVLTPVSTANTG